MATQTQTVVREEEKDFANLARMATEYNDRMTELKQRENTTCPPTPEDWWATFQWLIQQLADVVQAAGSAVTAYKAAEAMTRNAANIEALLDYIIRAVGGLESFFLGSYKLSRKMFGRGHFVRRILQKMWFYFHDMAPTAETADKLLGGLQILGAAVGLVLALKNLASIRKLNKKIEKSETDLREWEVKWTEQLRTQYQNAEDAAVALIEFFDHTDDLTDAGTQVTLHRLMRRAQHRLQQYKDKIGSATTELRRIEITAREHQVAARANRNAGTSAVIGGLGTVATAVMGPAGTVAKVVGSLGAATTLVGATAVVLSTKQLTRIEKLLNDVGRNMDDISHHEELYDTIVEKLEKFAQDFENKIEETKSAMQRLREAEVEKDAKLAAQQAEIEAMRRMLAQMNVNRS